MATATLSEHRVEWAAQPRQDTFLGRTEDEVLYGGAAGGGKALALTTPIATPYGWTTIGTIVVGDTVFANTGLPCRVVAVGPIMTGRHVHDVIFSDGSIIRADAEHLWATTTRAQRSAITRRNDEARSIRRALRCKRGTGKRPDLAIRNATHPTRMLPSPPPWEIRTTAEIANSVLVRGRVNHAVNVAGPLALPEVPLPIDPYILGVWLGDGTSASGAITTSDYEIVEALAVAGYEPHKRSGRYDYGTYGLSSELRRVGLLGAKRIPSRYLRASIEQRHSLVCGLMDTDGYVDERGKCEFTSTNRLLADGVVELLVSLGVQAVVTVGTATLYGKDCGEKYRISFRPHFSVFRLNRKLQRQIYHRRLTSQRRYVIDVREVPTEPVRCIAIDAPSHLYLAGRSLIPTHNSDALLLYQILRRKKYPGSKGLFLRRTYADLSKAGAALDRSKELLSGIAHYDQQQHRWTFGNGSLFEFGYLQHEDDKHNYQSSQYDDICFDELTQFTESQYLYLISRCRATVAGILPRIRAATNPGNVGHAWVKKRFIVGHRPEWRFELPRQPGQDQVRCACFVPAKLQDNQVLMDRDPGYWDRLMALPEDDRKALAYGDWDVFAGQYFKEWLYENHVVPPFAPPAHWRKWGALDWGYSKPLSFGVYTQDPDTMRIYRIKELYATELRDGEAIQRIKAVMGNDKIDAIHADPSLWQKKSADRDDDALSTAQIYVNAGLPLQPANNDRLNGWRRLHDLLAEGKDGKPMLQITANCVHFIETVPGLVHDQTKPEDLDSDGEDHCFVAGTMITTDRGPKAIEMIKVGDRVLTRQGYWPVTAWWSTDNQEVMTVRFNDGRSFTATRNHPVYVLSRGFVRVDELRYGDIIELQPTILPIGGSSIWQKARSFCSMASSLGDTLKRRTTPTGCITNRPATKGTTVSVVCTKKCGKLSMAQFLKGITSTTRMIIRSTTPMTTMSVSQGLTTYQIMASARSHNWNTWQLFDHSQQSGIDRPKGERGIANTRRVGNQSERRQPASSVEHSTTHRCTPKHPGFAPTNVNLLRDEAHGLMMNSGLALFAARITKRIGTATRRLVRGDVVRVVGSYPVGTKTVYNLTVDAIHEYYANGVLVHNCADECRYAVMARTTEKRKVPGLSIGMQWRS